MSIYWIPVTSPGRLAILARPRGGDWLEDDLHAFSKAGIAVLVSALTHEEQEELSLPAEPVKARELGMEFISFPVADRSVPQSYSALQRLAADVAEKLSAGKSVGVHCRASIGRASLVAAAVLAELKVAPNQIFELIGKCRGCAVPDTAEQLRWFNSYPVEKP